MPSRQAKRREPSLTSASSPFISMACLHQQEEINGRVIYTAHLGDRSASQAVKHDACRHVDARQLDSRAVLARSGMATRMTSMTDHKALVGTR